MIPDIMINITKDETSGLHPPYGKIYIRKIKYMSEDYPNIVCLDCLQEACEDTKKYDGRIPKWGSIYTAYNETCEICGQEKECTEPRDAGYPNFKYAKQRIRSKKIKNIKDSIDGTIFNS